MSDNIYRRGRIWWFRKQVGGETHRQSLKTEKRSEAREFAGKLARRLEAARVLGEERHTWSEAVMAWGETFGRGLAAGTAKRYGVSIAQVRHIFDELYVDQIDVKTIARVAHRPATTNATRRRDLTAVSSVLRACVSRGWLEINPAKLYDRGTVPERRDPIRLPTDAEVAAVIDRAPGRFADMIRFADLTGCRQEEIAGLERGDVRGGEVTLRKTKSNKSRTIRLATPGGDASRVVTRLVTTPSVLVPYLFWHGAGDRHGRYRNVSSRFREMVRGLVADEKIKPFRFHDLRHRFAVRWLQNGGDIYALSRHLGHGSVKVTEIYLSYVADETAQKTSQQRRFLQDVTGRKSAAKRQKPLK